MAAAIALISGACAPTLLEAPFPARADTVEPGNLLGPFDGQVLDAASGKPLSGAVVYGTWRFETGEGLTAPGGSASLSTETDADGRYRLPRLQRLPGGRARIVGFTLIIYKRGYVGYRSDRRFEDLGVRRDFAQRLNEVKLEPAGPSLSHVRHLRFLGGGGALRRALAGEVMLAALELGSGLGGGQPADTGPLLEADVLLSADELKAMTGYGGEFTLDKLADLPQTSTYDSRHFRAVGKPESYDAAIRVWKLPTAQAAEARYAAVLKEVPNAEVRDELGDRSLRGYDGKILAAATLDREHHVVLQLTCGVDQCRDLDQVVALLKQVLARVDRIGRAAGEEPAPEAHEQEDEAPAREEEPPPEEDRPFQLRPPGLRR